MKLTKLLTGTLLLLLLGSLGFNTAQAQKSNDHNVGLGVMIGEPTGLSFKAYTSSTTAVDAGLAWSLGRYDAINIHADYLWHSFDVFEDVDKGQLPVYYGVGGRIVFADDYPDPGDNSAVLGVRVPVGINYLFEDSPVGLFLEVAPIVNIAPETDFDIDGALGVRFYF